MKVSNLSDALNISHIYQESGLVLYAQPNFITEIEFFQVPDDQYFNMQFYLNNTGQTINDGHTGTTDADIDAPEAWQITQGSEDIVIAVIDHGVTSDHPDLPNTRQIRLDGSNFGDGDPDDPSPTGDHNHGNACAGIAAASRNNNQGIAGIAPNCKILPIRIDGAAVADIADAIHFARVAGADVISNSWGFVNPPNPSPNLHPAIVTEIYDATIYGRTYKGCVVVFASGNEADHVEDDDGFVAFPANVNVSGVLTIGATDRNDNQANYSATSSLIDVSAPSHRAYPWQIEGETGEVWTIDIPGDVGYNPWPADVALPHPPVTDEQLPNAGTNFLSFTGRFGGTSASCPQVAAEAALILTINSQLTHSEVFDIITETADEVGGYTYTNGKCNELGYGRINLHSAVLEVINRLTDDVTISGPSYICFSGTSFSSSIIPSGFTISWTHSNNLTLLSGQGTRYPVFKTNQSTYPESGWIQANLIYSGVSYDGPRKYIMGNPPHYNDITYTVYDQNFQEVDPYDLSTNTYYEIHVNYDNDYGCYLSDYERYLPEGYTISWTYGHMASFYTGTSDGGYFSVNASTCCGDDEEVLTGYLLSWSKRPSQMSIIPNPSGGETSIILMADGKQEVDANIIWDIEVYGTMQELKVSKQKIIGPKTSINVSHWNEGIYVVRARINTKWIYGKLVVKH